VARDVEHMSQIRDRLRREARPCRAGDVGAEWNRQRAWRRRELEDEILAADPDSEVAGDIRDHRAAGHWTTWQHNPAASDEAGR
jgi:hypothetical protein